MAERRADVLDQGGHQDAAPFAFVGFFEDPVAVDGLSGPKDHYAAGFVEGGLDDLAEGFAGGDLPVSPNRPALGFEVAGEEFGAGTVGAGVADEDVAHWRA